MSEPCSLPISQAFRHGNPEQKELISFLARLELTNSATLNYLVRFLPDTLLSVWRRAPPRFVGCQRVLFAELVALLLLKLVVLFHGSSHIPRAPHPVREHAEIPRSDSHRLSVVLRSHRELPLQDEAGFRSLMTWIDHVQACINFGYIQVVQTSCAQPYWAPHACLYFYFQIICILSGESPLVGRVRQSRPASACSFAGFLPTSAAASIYLYKLPYAIASVPSLSGHAVAYRWRSRRTVPSFVESHNFSFGIGSLLI